MFDLFRSRAKAVRYMLGALLLLVAASMVITLIPGYGSGGNVSEHIVAEIGKEALTTRDVHFMIQQQMRNNAFPREMAEHYVPLLIQQMITERAVAYQAQRMGFVVTEADVALAIRSMLPELFQGGEFAGRDVYAQYLSQINTSIPEFEGNVRKQMLLLKLQNIVLEGTIVSQKEIEDEFRRRNDKIKVEHISLSPASFRTEANVSREEMLDYFNSNRASYRIGERRSFDLVVADEARVSANASVPDTELRRIYDSSGDRFRIPERVKVRHILLKTTDKPKDEFDKIRAAAEDLLQKIKSGADFAELAKKHSEDPGSASKGGDLDWIVRGQTVKNFEETAFSLKPKEISNVISTEYGFHILQVLEKEQARVRPFEEVKAELAADRTKQYVYDRMQTLIDQGRAELIRNPTGAAAIAGKLGLLHVSVEKAGPGDPVPEVGSNQEFEVAIGSLQKGGVTPVMQVAGNKLLVAVLRDIFPLRPAEFAEVEPQIREQLLTRKAETMARQRVKELEEKLKTFDGDLKKVAQSMKLELKTSPEFTRNESVEGVTGAAYLHPAFEQPVGSLLGPVTFAEQTFVAKVIGKSPADLSNLPGEREGIFSALKANKARVRKDLFEDGLLIQLINEGEVKIYEETIKRLVANYRG